MRKTGLLVMALVLAMGMLGVGYAAWTDSVSISGNVTTGTLDLVVTKYSGTYVWKVSTANDTDKMVIVDGWNPSSDPVTDAVDAFPNAPHPPGTTGIDPVCVAMAAPGATADDIVVIIRNAFPLPDGTIKADFLLHYAGSIPVKVTVAELKVKAGGTIDSADVVINFYESDVDGTTGSLIGGAGALMGRQLHFCEYVKVIISVDLSEQDEADMGKSGTIEGTITVTQWNKA